MSSARKEEGRMHTFTAGLSVMDTCTHTRKIIRVQGARDEGDALWAATHHLDSRGLPIADIVPVPPGTPLDALRTEPCTVTYVTATENLYQTKTR